ncbi:hypothetical protein J6590_027192 [Homalodisca vitripennis]|nr:hypothetical protein J6590_027192 [Homalodisca vitripennis]
MISSLLQSTHRRNPSDITVRDKSLTSGRVNKLLDTPNCTADTVTAARAALRHCVTDFSLGTVKTGEGLTGDKSLIGDLNLCRDR